MPPMPTLHLSRVGNAHPTPQQQLRTAMEFYTAVLRQSANSWVALCLENGLVGQGSNQEDAINKLKEAIESFQAIYETETNIYKAPICIE